MDRDWVDARLSVLTARIACRVGARELEPAPMIYDRLTSGDDDDLCWVAAQFLTHLDVRPGFCHVEYDWSIGLDSQSAGQISKTVRGYDIVIPFSMAGDGHRVGTILAHEMSHAFLLCNGIRVSDLPQEVEQMTDLTAVVLGLGKMLLNGLVTPANPLGPTYRVGYLPPDLIAYAYVRISAARQVDEETLVKNLVPHAVHLVMDALSSA